MKMNEEEKQKTLTYLKEKWMALEKLGLKEESEEFKDKYHSLKDWGNMNYFQHTKTKKKQTDGDD